MNRSVVKIVYNSENPLIALVLKTETKKYDLCFFNNSKEVDVYSQLTKLELTKLLNSNSYIIKEVKIPFNLYFEEELN